MRRSLYLGDTVYEVIAEPGFEVKIQNIKSNIFIIKFLGRSSSICWSCSSNV